MHHLRVSWSICANLTHSGTPGLPDSDAYRWDETPTSRRMGCLRLLSWHQTAEGNKWERTVGGSQRGFFLHKSGTGLGGTRSLERGVRAVTIVAITVGNHAVHIGLVGAPALLLVGLRMADRRARTKAATPGGDSSAPRKDLRLTTIAALSASAGLLHATVIQEHLKEYWLFGAFFIIAASLQVVWAVMVFRGVGRRWILAGAVGNAAVVLLWWASRTIGLPFGPTPWRPEAFGLINIAVSVIEVAVVALCVARLSENAVSSAENPTPEQAEVASGDPLLLFPESYAVTRRIRSSMSPSRLLRRLLDSLPEGHAIAEEVWQRRHRGMQWLLWLHVPAVALYATARGKGPIEIFVEVGLVAAGGVAAWLAQESAIPVSRGNAWSGQLGGTR